MISKLLLQSDDNDHNLGDRKRLIWNCIVQYQLWGYNWSIIVTSPVSSHTPLVTWRLMGERKGADMWEDDINNYWWYCSIVLLSSMIIKIPITGLCDVVSVKKIKYLREREREVICICCEVLIIISCRPLSPLLSPYQREDLERRWKWFINSSALEVVGFEDISVSSAPPELSR